MHEHIMPLWWNLLDQLPPALHRVAACYIWSSLLHMEQSCLCPDIHEKGEVLATASRAGHDLRSLPPMRDE